MKKIRKRLTYANVMSSIAVFLVIGGATAFAALGKNTVGTKQLKRNAVTTAKIKKQAVASGKIKDGAVKSKQLANSAVGTDKLADSAVTTGKISNDAVTGDKVNEATLGEVPKAAFAVNAENAAPRAYARALPNSGGGGVDEARSKGVTDASVTFVGGSVYCFELGFTPKNIQATVDWIGGGANTFAHATLQAFVICPAGTDASVRTTDNAGGGIGTISFYVQFVG